MQKRCPFGPGPSGKTCPRWPPQRAQVTSVRTIPRLRSSCSSTASATAGSVKLGQPVPESNFVSELNSSRPAGPAAVDAVGLRVRVGTGERRLGPLLAQDVKALGVELLAPLLLSLLKLLGHTPRLRAYMPKLERVAPGQRRVLAVGGEELAHLVLGRAPAQPRQPRRRASGRPRRAPAAGRRGPGPPRPASRASSCRCSGSRAGAASAGSCSAEVGAPGRHLARRAHQRDRALGRKAARVELRRRAPAPARTPRAGRAASAGAAAPVAAHDPALDRGRPRWTRSAARRPPRRAPRTARGAGAVAATACGESPARSAGPSGSGDGTRARSWSCPSANRMRSMPFSAASRDPAEAENRTAAPIRPRPHDHLLLADPQRPRRARRRARSSLRRARAPEACTARAGTTSCSTVVAIGPSGGGRRRGMSGWRPRRSSCRGPGRARGAGAPAAGRRSTRTRRKRGHARGGSRRGGRHGRRKRDLHAALDRSRLGENGQRADVRLLLRVRQGRVI